MASIFTPGLSVGIQSGGKQTIRIPVATTANEDATQPTTPVGFRLIGVNYSRREDGGRNYVYDYEQIGDGSGTGGAGGSAVDKQVNGQAVEQPIETHPKFNGVGGYGTVNAADLAMIQNPTSGVPPVFTATGINLVAAEALYELKSRKVESFYTATGVSYSETTEQTNKPTLEDLCTVQDPPSDAPTLLTPRNWLFNSMTAQNIVDPLGGASAWRVTRTWLASDTRGWNADFAIYGPETEPDPA